MSIPEKVRNGRCLRLLGFGWDRGRKLVSIISKSGRVYRPHPYDIPAEPLKNLAFSLNLTLALMDTGVVNANHFDGSEKRCVEYWNATLELLRRIESDAMLSNNPQDRIEYQPTT